MKIILLSLFLIFDLSLGFSQNILITGKIIDYYSGRPMPYASISLDSTLSTTSNHDGTFSLRTSKISQSDTLKIMFISYFELNIINLPSDTNTIRFEVIPLFEYFTGNSMDDYSCGRFDFKCKRAWRKHIKEEKERINKYYSDRNLEISSYDFRFNNKGYIINVNNHCIDLKQNK
jgi:hypothetical protein